MLLYIDINYILHFTKTLHTQLVLQNNKIMIYLTIHI